MPWDVPDPLQGGAPQPAPVDDVVPYGDSDVTVYEERYEEESFSPAASQTEGGPVPVTSPDPAPTPPTSAQVEVAPASPGPEPSTPANPVPAPSTLATPDPSALSSDLTPEFSSIASMLAEAFGQPVALSVESAATTTDEEAAAELSHDASPDLGAGFTDEPAEDGD